MPGSQHEQPRREVDEADAANGEQHVERAPAGDEVEDEELERLGQRADED